MTFELAPFRRGRRTYNVKSMTMCVCLGRREKAKTVTRNEKQLCRGKHVWLDKGQGNFEYVNNLTNLLNFESVVIFTKN